MARRDVVWEVRPSGHGHRPERTGVPEKERYALLQQEIAVWLKSLRTRRYQAEKEMDL